MMCECGYEKGSEECLALRAKVNGHPAPPPRFVRIPRIPNGEPDRPFGSLSHPKNLEK